ncbi:MAG: hypothetical protein NZ895_04255 [Archaeoglobaceae archaeon]|nr:hypothetical protein [Archaeoglobaceae archaeon]MCX8152554.1 hypothetical protein [Archaeoglobaceae archaeon]MDW8014164.1 hypothetical protein [Archaeoglobaceae archaeon]
MKAILIGLILLLILYGIVFGYTFGFSPMVKQSSIENWIQKETSKKPSYMQSDVCRHCHLKVFTALQLGNHSTVECESCHGVGGMHTKLRTKESIIVENTRDACMVCHKKVEGRNIVVVEEDHGKGVRCTYCHDPHSTKTRR